MGYSKEKEEELILLTPRKTIRPNPSTIKLMVILAQPMYNILEIDTILCKEALVYTPSLCSSPAWR